VTWITSDAAAITLWNGMFAEQAAPFSRPGALGEWLFVFRVWVFSPGKIATERTLKC